MNLRVPQTLKNVWLVASKIWGFSLDFAYLVLCKKRCSVNSSEQRTARGHVGVCLGLQERFILV
jgi:hypothetical protein